VELDDYAALVQGSDRKVLLLVLDGLGGLPVEPGGPTALEAARTPHLDELLRRGECGLHDPVGPGVTPGSGPGHLALFGYDPARYRIGRGVLTALGIGRALGPTEVAARGNFCTLDGEGRVADRRAGRISTEEARPLCELLDEIEVEGVEVSVRSVKEHRFLLVLGFPEPPGDEVSDTDPGRPGVPPREPEAATAESGPVARAARTWLREAGRRLDGRRPANMVLLRGFARRPDWPRFPETFGMRSLAVAAYPMYRGVARLVGMEAVKVEDGLPALVGGVVDRAAEYDFLFAHVKGTDRAGEDGDFDRKVAVIEETDRRIPDFLAAGPEVLLVTGDHSTPAALRSHSWHPVPWLLAGPAVRPSARDREPRPGGTAGAGFGERSCVRLGTLRRGHELMPLAVAASGRLAKFGA